MNVKVKIHEKLSKDSGENTTKIPINNQETIDTLLIKLSRRNPRLVESILDPRTGNLEDDYNIKLNGRSIKKIKGLHTTLKNKDELFITPQES